MDSRAYGRYLGQVIVTAMTIATVLVVAAAALWAARRLLGGC